ncbi:MAG: hypothetical protein Q9P01_04755 [Anaerolineae bacterium]|nr:hypothetical protein [Anaerolineae bacterium]
MNYLEQRESGAAWTEETVSLRNVGNLRGLIVTFSDNEIGWVVFQKAVFQLSHFVLSPNVSPKMTGALIAAVHQQFPMQDTKVENVPSNHYSWSLYEKCGYVVAFRRIEMILEL